MALGKSAYELIGLLRIVLADEILMHNLLYAFYSRFSIRTVSYGRDFFCLAFYRENTCSVTKPVMFAPS